MEKKKVTKKTVKKTAPAAKAKPAAKRASASAAESAVIELGGSQHLVEKGTKLEVGRLSLKEGGKEKVRALILEPRIAEGSVTFKVVSHKRGPKITAATYKAKSRYRRKVGSRAELSEVIIEKVELGK